MADYDRAEFTAWLAASCERQGVPLTINDPAVIKQIATLVGRSTKCRGKSELRSLTVRPAKIKDLDACERYRD
ncbi:Uncharacterised protein [Mycobacteroides abscessus subsp. massiliense]|uniref:hypothetical protein n=1 Tax=Mycobacteroides abscessus TaxID=36809 RepID=UPI0009A56717|nr:hypothetical protein [Mycobacteroides abscessus]SKT85562.1 Uncharacterised protein [Mycobacteroides abscessus subsp. massiliense]